MQQVQKRVMEGDTAKAGGAVVVVMIGSVVISGVIGVGKCGGQVVLIIQN